MLASRFNRAAVALLVVFVLAAAAIPVISRTAAGEQPKPPAPERARVKWEYKALSHDEIKAVEFNKRGTETSNGGLNMLGEDGWELVAIEPPVIGPVPGIGGRPALYSSSGRNSDL